jgi:hypothetical protein
MEHIDRFIPIFIVIAAFGAGCSPGDGEGFVRGSFTVSSCNLEREDFNLKINYFTATYFQNSLTIRLQHKGGTQVYADGLFLEIRDVESVSENLDTPLQIEIEPPLDEFKQNGPGTSTASSSGLPATTYQSPARATLYLNETCPDNTLGFTDGDGEIVFEKIYRPDKSDRIKGRFELEFIDPRTWESPEEIGDHAEVEGEFDFEYSRRMPEQTFL